MHRVLERQLRKLGIGAEPPTPEQWTRVLERVDRAYTDADQDRYTLERALDLSSAEMRKRFTELRDAQKQLLEASRKAGMADVATNVLHNIGNVLNSLNLSAELIGGLVRSSPRTRLSKALALLQDPSSASTPAQTDEGKNGRCEKLVAYLCAVDHALVEEGQEMLKEVHSLSKNVEHIKSIVTQQLAAARGDRREGECFEQVDLAEFVEDALTVLRATLPIDSGISVETEVMRITVRTDRHKLFQIVTNLLANARDAIATGNSLGVIRIAARRVPDGRIELSVQDDGIGIASETLTQVFRHGFTTKTDGHGFGLHSCACAAMELGGTLRAYSDGPGLGARFVLVVPSDRTQRPSPRKVVVQHGDLP